MVLHGEHFAYCFFFFAPLGALEKKTTCQLLSHIIYANKGVHLEDW